MTPIQTKLIPAFQKAFRNKGYRIWLVLLGILSLPVVLIVYLLHRGDNGYSAIHQACEAQLRGEGVYEEELRKARLQTQRKQDYFHLAPSARDEKADEAAAGARFRERVKTRTDLLAQAQGTKAYTVQSVFGDLLGNPFFFVFSLIVSFPMYLLLLIYQIPTVKYIFERLVMMIFVVLGVIFFVFTILHCSPMQPAENLLGDQASQQQLDAFNRTYGLDQPYIVQLGNAFKDILTFDLGMSYKGNEDIALAISQKFPTTLELAVFSMLVSLVIAIPAGIISAIKQYSSFDYIAMFLALIGLSIPNFWLGLILIMNFSIKLHWLPATFVPGQWVSFIMPAIVLGTGMSATVARMTRSSMLEVKNSDYILTARAKGLSERKVVFKHILRNAMIPIVTVIGLQFGALLGGSSVTEKVFNISGLGSWIVDKQFIPDIPVVLAGVVYIAMIISLANLVVDLLYTILDPRIKT